MGSGLVRKKILYNFVRIHSTIRMTPAMAAGVTDRLYDLDWILDMVDEAWPKPNRPKTYKRKKIFYD